MAQELLEQVLQDYETHREDPPRSRALRPVFSRAFRTQRAGFSKEEPSFSKLITSSAGFSEVGAPWCRFLYSRSSWCRFLYSMSSG